MQPAPVDPTFVAREAELAALDRLFEDGASVRLAYVYGVGGVGKSALLRAFAVRCLARGRRATRIDMRDLDPTPESLLSALARAVSRAPPTRRGGRARPLAASWRLRGTHVLLIDSYQATDVLDRWVRDELLAQLPAGVPLVLASRSAPSAELRLAPGLDTLPLAELAPAAARALLAARGAPERAYAQALALTRGHPLALALIGDLLARDPDLALTFADVPDVVRVLVQRFVGDTTDAHQRAALEVAAVVRVVDEPTLGALVPGADAAALLRWLEARAMFDVEPSGLRPHELAREVLSADLRWRAADRHAALVLAAIDHCVARFQRGNVDPTRVALDVMFIHRFGFMLGTDWDEAAALRADFFRPTDLPALRAMTLRHEGPESEALLVRWLARGLEVRVVRDRAGDVLGFIAFVALDRARASDVQADPATRAAARALKGKVRPGEAVNLIRWWMCRDTYQAMSPEHVVIGSLMMRKNFTPGLAFSLWPVTDERHWSEVNAAMGLVRFPAADFDSGAGRHVVFGLDMRECPMALHLAAFTRRTLAGPDVHLPPEAERAVLAREQFDRALRDALKHLHKPERLAPNPLLRSRLVLDAAGADADTTVRAATLRRLVEAAAAPLAEAPRTAGLYAALLHTYLVPVAKQEVAAELTGVSFATYRRYLAAALEVVSARLWEREVA